MSLVPNFTAGQAIGLPSQVVLTDTSTGSDGAVTQRRVYFKKVGNSYLVPTGTTTNYVSWSYALASKTFDILNIDYALLITVEWLDVSNNVLYSKSKIYEFSLYGKNFQYQLTQGTISIPNVSIEGEYYLNKGRFETEIDNAAIAVELIGNQAYSQAALDRATNYRLRQNYYF